MKIIHPSLFMVMTRFPERRKALRKMYRKSESFKAICHNYQKCSEALGYWKTSEHEAAPARQREYTALLNELELEIIQILEERYSA